VILGPAHISICAGPSITFLFVHLWLYALARAYNKTVRFISIITVFTLFIRFVSFLLFFIFFSFLFCILSQQIKYVTRNSAVADKVDKPREFARRICAIWKRASLTQNTLLLCYHTSNLVVLRQKV